jgi:YHS domain-containing protein
MSRAKMCLFSALLFLLATSAGCTDSAQPKVAEDASPAAAAQATAPTDEVAEALAKLDPADREVATQQAVCPVSDEKLGSMGAPVKVVHDGHDVYLCCAGCQEDFAKKPQKFLAKLKK